MQGQLNSNRLNNVFYAFSDVEEIAAVGKEVKGKIHTFYQVLIDSRDCPYIVSFSFKRFFLYLNGFLFCICMLLPENIQSSRYKIM